MSSLVFVSPERWRHGLFESRAGTERRRRRWRRRRVRVTAAGVWVVYVGWGLGLVCVLCCYSAVFLRIISFVFCLILFLPFLPGRAKKRKSSPPPLNSHSCESECEEKERENEKKRKRIPRSLFSFIISFLSFYVFEGETYQREDPPLRWLPNRMCPSVGPSVCGLSFQQPVLARLDSSSSLPLSLSSSALLCVCVCVEQATTIHLTQSHTNNNKVTERRRTAVKIEIETENLFKTLTGGKGRGALV